VIDKLEHRLSPTVTFRPEIQKLIRDVNFYSGNQFMRPSRLYSGVGNLTPLGIDALLHYNCKQGRKGAHKLELLQTGKKPYSALVAQIEAVIDGSIENLETMRIDLCADVPGVPVAWFHPRLSIRHKRLSHQIGPMKLELIGKAGIETISAGRKPNVVRLYDKVAESKMQFRKMVRRCSKDAEPLDFEKQFGFQKDCVLTRVERQYGGGRIPDPLSTFGKLGNAAQFNPFDILSMTENSHANLPTVRECNGVSEFLEGMGLHEILLEMGFQQGKKWLNVESKGNAARILKRLNRFIPGTSSDSVSIERIVEIYQASVTQQLSA